MRYKDLKKNAKAVSNVAIIVLIAVLMVSASSVVILLVQGGKTSSLVGTVKKGDLISVNYIGRLADGRVFDTSLYSVASDNALYPKSLSFTLRGNATTYTPLQFTVGGGQLIKGFDSGVVGMAKGQTKVLTIPFSQGYGPLNESNMHAFSLLATEPVFKSMNVTNFISTYSVQPAIGITVKDPIWGWNVSVLQVSQDADLVRVANTPQAGQSFAVFGNPTATPAYGWYATVVSIDSTVNGGDGIILVEHLLKNSDSGFILGKDSMGGIFMLDSVNTNSGTARMNYNGEIVGATLVFTVTIVSIN